MKPLQWFAGLLIIIGVFTWASVSSGQGSAEDLYKRGSELQKAGKFKEALASYEKALKAGREHYGAMYGRGACLFNLGDYAAAETAARDLLRSYPDDTHGVVLLGRTLLKSGSTQEARRLFLRALDRNPQDVAALAGMGEAEYLIGNRFAGEHYLKKALALSPNDRTVQQLLGPVEAANREYLKEGGEERREVTRSAPSGQVAQPPDISEEEEPATGPPILVYEQPDMSSFLEEDSSTNTRRGARESRGRSGKPRFDDRSYWGLDYPERP